MEVTYCEKWGAYDCIAAMKLQQAPIRIIFFDGINQRLYERHTTIIDAYLTNSGRIESGGDVFSEKIEAFRGKIRMMIIHVKYFQVTAGINATSLLVHE